MFSIQESIFHAQAMREREWRFITAPGPASALDYRIDVMSLTGRRHTRRNGCVASTRPMQAST
jgi:hypothetical protein